MSEGGGGGRGGVRGKREEEGEFERNEKVSVREGSERGEGREFVRAPAKFMMTPAKFHYDPLPSLTPANL